MGDEDETLGELAEENPREVLATIDVQLGGENLSKEQLITLIANIAREEDLNLPRLINEHPDAVEELWGQSIEFDDHVVELVDDALEGRTENLR